MHYNEIVLTVVDECEWRLRSDERVAQPASGPFRDYILSDYEPLTDPSGRAHSSTLLRYFLRVYGLIGLWPVLSRVRDFVGADETVWGAKCWAQAPGSAFDRAGIELYFYNRSRNAPGNRKSVTALVKALEHEIRIESSLRESVPYMMCSLELDVDVLAYRRSGGFRIYVSGDRRRHGYDGVSYLVRGNRLHRENIYQFYRAPSEEAEFRSRLAESLHAPSEEVRRALAPAELDDCFTFCFAQKRFGDAVYFSRIDTGRLLAFVTAHMPGPLPRVLELETAEFAHLRWDVGLDFVRGEDGSTARVTKAGFYGFL